ncbi:hypothetical protein C489_17572 [Natrinema versiforme JCM 10478]|uniref:Uncharacterized protein n=1 Tax=Natrinema versiforme JCM 10478 TaxID=1227496 RepID=L9XRQ2_9EURY|nr:hypothetical protein C489_17572 [Natrinema versiforme JCM 10478]
MDIARLYRTADQGRKLLRAERRTGSSFDLSPRYRLDLYRRGFLSKSGVIYRRSRPSASGLDPEGEGRKLR